MKVLFRHATLLLFMLFAVQVQATHIAGAELWYSCSGNNLYNIRLKMYRDCLNASPNAVYDDPLLLYIFRGSDGTVYDTYEIIAPSSTPEIQPENWNACVATPYDICVQEGTYILNNLFLPPINGGYNIAWTRCCRNNVITNFASPQCEGITFLAHVPGPTEAVCNSMPVFNNSPSIFLCAGETYYFDYSATDPDGDSLVYSLSHPFSGTNTGGLGTGAGLNGGCGNTLAPNLSATNPMGPPPYVGVQYATGYSANNPFGPGGHASINPATGFMEAYPVNNGIYVMAVSVKEYRNGILLSENKRDFQFHVIACRPQGPPPSLTHNLTGLNAVNDTLYVLAGRPFCYSFNVTDPVQPSSIDVTPLSVSFGGNGGFPPPYATIQLNGSTPPVTGTICWQPSCDYAGNLVPMIISARDINDCPNYNIVFDTVWVRVLPPIPAPPVLNTSTTGLPMSGDTIVLGVQEDFCFNFTLVDTFGGGSLVGQCFLQDTLGNMLGQVHTVTTTQVGDTIFGEVCWETYCNFGRTYMFVIRGQDEYQCPPNDVVYDTIYLRIPTPTNPSPQLITDILPNTTNGDTILANVNETFCFDIMVLDTSLLAGSGINFSAEVYDENWVLVTGNPFTYSVTGTTDSISGQICWTPRCPSVDQLVKIIVRGEQTNECGQLTYDFDTIYVRVDEPFKPVPLISHDLGPNFPGNQQIDVHDDETFCFSFQLEDTVTPTHVVYDINVFYANGTPFVGSLPTLTYTTQSDSLLQGTICWTVPCALANQQFEIKMTGRDTFDCRASNTVYDSVIISHTETPPSPLTFCNATVANDDASNTLSWRVGNLESDVVGFLVYRKRDDAAAFAVHDSIFSIIDTSYTDVTNVQSDLHSYCYQMAVMDRCGNLSPISNQICTVLLNGNPVDYTTQLEWTEFIGWNNGPAEYQIWRNSPIDGGFGPTYLETVAPNIFSFVDPVVSKARLCYRVIAISDGTGCADQSQSNEICVNFPPTLYVPTAFTPNGDGLNDYFSSFGEFVESFQLDIYDRWGKLLFRSTDVAHGWDGTLDGQIIPEGVFVYKVKVTGYDGEVLEKEGSVTLIR